MPLAHVGSGYKDILSGVAFMMIPMNQLGVCGGHQYSIVLQYFAWQ